MPSHRSGLPRRLPQLTLPSRKTRLWRRRTFLSPPIRRVHQRPYSVCLGRSPARPASERAPSQQAQNAGLIASPSHSIISWHSVSSQSTAVIKTAGKGFIRFICGQDTMRFNAWLRSADAGKYCFAELGIISNLTPRPLGLPSRSALRAAPRSGVG